MEMYLNKEEDILNEEFRKEVIKQINGEENIKRKKEMKKRYDVYRDLTKKYVKELVIEEMGKDAWAEIVNRVANISVAKKIINKKANIYTSGVCRKVVGDDELTEKLSMLSKALDLNIKMKKNNRFVELFKNTAIRVIPWQNESTGKFELLINVLPPYKYDVIADRVNTEYGKVYITSAFNEADPDNVQKHAQPGESGIRSTTKEMGQSPGFRAGDRKDQTIANSPNDLHIDNQEYIWTSSRYHFTTDEEGVIVSGRQEEDLSNPIQMLNFIQYSEDQDGAFWAVGGEDLIDGAILIDLILSDIYYIAKFQGLGLGYLFGKGVPDKLKVGPASFLTLQVKDGDPEPKIGFANANPMISEYMKLVEQNLAFLLSTNNLEPGTIQGALSATGAQSGIQEMVRKSELKEESLDKTEMYLRNEYKVLRVIFAWLNLFAEKKLLDGKFQEVGMIKKEDLDINIKFNEPQMVLTEKEKVEVLKARKELGIDTMLDTIMRDNPDLSPDEARVKLGEILKQRLLEQRTKMIEMVGNEEQENLENEE
jgi:hypothetical protein